MVADPGVARSIVSDVDNLLRLIKVFNVLPPGKHEHLGLLRVLCCTLLSICHRAFVLTLAGMYVEEAAKASLSILHVALHVNHMHMNKGKPRCVLVTTTEEANFLALRIAGCEEGAGHGI